MPSAAASTSTVVERARSWGRMLSWCGARCCTTTSAILSSGACLTSSLSASRPPAEAPIPTTKNFSASRSRVSAASWTPEIPSRISADSSSGATASSSSSSGLAGRSADGAHQLLGASVLEDVGRGPAAQRLHHVRLGRVHGEDHDLGLGEALHDSAGDVEAVQAGHHEVRDQNVGLQTLREARELE